MLGLALFAQFGDVELSGLMAKVVIMGACVSTEKLGVAALNTAQPEQASPSSHAFTCHLYPVPVERPAMLAVPVNGVALKFPLEEATHQILLEQLLHVIPDTQEVPVVGVAGDAKDPELSATSKKSLMISDVSGSVADARNFTLDSFVTP
jgi:hypothetical protein